MLTIRLARTGRTNYAQFRVVLTEHTKSPKAGYKEVLGFYNPIKHEAVINTDAVKKYVNNGVSLSSRVAKLVYKQTNDEVYKKFFSIKNLERKTKNPDKYA